MAQVLALRLLILVLALCVTQIQGSDGGAQDCCLKYSQRRIPYKLVRSYRKQEPSLGCPIPAILFLPRKRNQAELCADPKEGWVRQLMKRLDSPPAQGCRRDGGNPKSGKKKKGAKGCKRTEPTQAPRGP